MHEQAPMGPLHLVNGLETGRNIYLERLAIKKLFFAGTVLITYVSFVGLSNLVSRYWTVLPL